MQHGSFQSLPTVTAEMPSSVFRPSRCDLDCHLEKPGTVCQQGGTPCRCCCRLAVTDYLMSSNSIGDHVFTASLLSPLSADPDTYSLQSSPVQYPSTSFLARQRRNNGYLESKLELLRRCRLPCLSGPERRSPFARLPQPCRASREVEGRTTLSTTSTTTKPGRLESPFKC
jgi:hypothetical protein